MPPGRLDGCYFLDANLINARQGLPDINQLEKWCDEGVIDLMMTPTVMTEAQSNSALRKAKVDESAWSSSRDTLGGEEEISQKIAAVVFPHKPQLTPRDQNDVKMLYDVFVAGGTLITNDGASKSQPRGILGSADDLMQHLGIQVLSPGGAVAEIVQRIAACDASSR